MQYILMQVSGKFYLVIVEIGNIQSVNGGRSVEQGEASARSVELHQVSSFLSFVSKCIFVLDKHAQPVR